jgi:hypothetical protein
MEAFIKTARRNYYRKLLDSILTMGNDGVPSNADKSSNLSKRIAVGIMERPPGACPHGNLLTLKEIAYCRDFLRMCKPTLSSGCVSPHFPPGARMVLVCNTRFASEKLALKSIDGATKPIYTAEVAEARVSSFKRK